MMPLWNLTSHQAVDLLTRGLAIACIGKVCTGKTSLIYLSLVCLSASHTLVTFCSVCMFAPCLFFFLFCLPLSRLESLLLLIRWQQFCFTVVLHFTSEGPVQQEILSLSLNSLNYPVLWIWLVVRFLGPSIPSIYLCCFILLYWIGLLSCHVLYLDTRSW